MLDYTSMEVDGTLILATDKKVYLSTEGTTITPKPSHSISINDVIHGIERVKELNPGGTVVFWELQVRA